MTIKQYMISITVLMIAAVSVCKAEEPVTVTLTPEADADVRQSVPDYAKGDRDGLFFKTAENDAFKVYIRYRLPSDFGTVVSAQLRLVRSYLGAWDFTYNLHGLNDDVAGQEWLELHGLTWNNAPANDTASSAGFTQDATGILDTLTVVGGENGGALGDEYVFTDEGGNLAAFLSTDTDGVVNLLLARDGSSNSVEAFASKEHATYTAPSLELTYIPSISGIGRATLNAAADSDIRQSDPDYAKGDRPWHYLCNSPGNSGKVYVRFDLPADVGTILNASLVFTVGDVYPLSYTSPVNVHGLIDGVSGEFWDDMPHYLTWNNAPANDTSSDYDFTGDATDILAEFTINGGRYGAAVGDQYTVSNQQILDYLNADTNGVVNFMLGRTGVSSAYHGIAAREMGTQPGPQLVIEYETKHVDVYLETDFNKDLVVNLIDFAYIAADWLNCTDPANPDCL
jgi:hypothetical protein